jgi:hypothetical protein
LKNYLNLLCFLLQGLPAEGTISAVMAYMIDDFFKPNAVMDFPVREREIGALYFPKKPLLPAGLFYF